MQLTEKQFNAIYKSFNSKISRYVSAKINNREDAQELIEDVFIKVSQFYPTFDESKSQLQTWIYNIAKNVLIDYFRKKKLTTVSINVELDEDSEHADHIDVIDSALNPLDAFIRDEQMSNIKNNFSKLNTLERKLMTMYALDDMSYNEIVEVLDIPLGTVKGTIHRARTILRESVPQLVNA